MFVRLIEIKFAISYFFNRLQHYFLMNSSRLLWPPVRFA